MGRSRGGALRSYSQWIAQLLKAPLDEGVDGRCGLCRGTAAPVVSAQALPSSFRDYDHLDGDQICQACFFVMAGRPPDTLRMWSAVMVELGGLPPSAEKAPGGSERLWLGNKADLTPALDVLLDPPPRGAWGVSLADSGKVHVIPYAEVMGPGEWGFRLERHRIRGDRAQFKALVHRGAALLEAGHSSQSVLAGEPHPSQWRSAEAMRAWLAHAPHLARWRGTPFMEGALFCLSRKTAARYTEERWKTPWTWPPA